MSEVSKISNYAQKILNIKLKNCSEGEVAAAKMFNIFDTDKDGVMTKEEYDAINAENYQKKCEKQNIALQKEGITEDPALTLNYTEIGEVFKNTGKIDFSTYVTKIKNTLDFINNFDKNGDKNVSFKEHINYYQNSIKEVDGYIKDAYYMIKAYKEFKKPEKIPELEKAIVDSNEYKKELETNKKTLELRDDLSSLEYAFDKDKHDKDGNIIQYTFADVLRSEFADKEAK